MIDKTNFSNPPPRGSRRGAKGWLAIAAFVAAVVFAAVGMALPPQGEIDSSVLILVAQLFVLCATFLGIKDLNLPKS